MEALNGTDMRVFYTRTGTAKYISHLDINRCMQRALARSHLPIWYTQGFNPHLYITFAMPTSLGYESDCETMDMRVTQDIPAEEIKARLNASLPMDLRVYRVAPPQHKADEIAKADYRVVVSAPGKTGAELEALLRDFLDSSKIPVQKRTKKGMKEIDLKPLLELRALENDEEAAILVLRLAAGNTTNINPGLVFEAFTGLYGIKTDCIRVRKLCVYTDNPIKDEIFE